MKRFLFTGLALGCALAIAACSSTGSKVAVHRASPKLAVYRAYELRFRYPAVWTTRQFNDVSSVAASLVDLSDQAMHNPCGRTRSGVRCTLPVSRLGPDGVLVQWDDVGMPGWSLSQEPGRPITVAGRPARLAVSGPGSCDKIGATESISAAIPSVPSNFYYVFACLRGPHLRAAARQVEAMIESATFPGS